MKSRSERKNWIPACAGMSGWGWRDAHDSLSSLRKWGPRLSHASARTGSFLLQSPQMPDRPSRRDRLRGGDDRRRVDAVVPIEIRQRSGLAEMLDAERAGAVAVNRAEPGERRRMAVERGDQRAMRR